MYYDWADQSAAYVTPYQYMLTSNIIARPVVQAISNGDDAVAVAVWLPPVAPDSGYVDEYPMCLPVKLLYVTYTGSGSQLYNPST